MKRILCIVLSAMLFAGTMAMGVSAADGPAFKVSSAEAAPGSEVTLTISVEGNTGIVSAELNVEYDESKLEWTKVAKGDWAGRWDVAVGEAITWFAEDPMTNVTDNGTFATLTFKIKDDAEIGLIPVTVTYDEENVYAVNGNSYDNVAFEVVAGQVQVVNFVEGGKIVVSSPGKRKAVGKTVEVPVIIEENIGIVSAEISVGYDEDILELAEVKAGDFGGTISATGNVITWDAEDHSVNVTQNGTFATLVFNIKEMADKETGTEVTVAYEDDKVYNANRINVKMAASPGTIFTYLRGDINGDGRVNNKDITVLMRYVKYLDIEVVEEALNVNGDEKVNNKDITVLMRYVKYKDIEIN